MASISRPDKDVLAHSSAVSTALLCASASLFATVGWTVVGALNIWQWYSALAVNTLALLALLRFRKLPEAWSIVSFLICTTAVLLASGYSNDLLARSGKTFEAFIGFKLMAIVIAVIAPRPVWLGFFVISLCGLAGVIQFLCFPAAIQATLPIQEPWAVCIYALVSGLVLRFRLRGVEFERSLSRLKAEKRALNDLARVFLGLRDMTNTPLQSIELTVQLLGEGKLTANEAITHLNKALLRLRELSKLLTTYEKNTDWSQNEASFDAVTMLEKKLKEIMVPGK